MFVGDGDQHFAKGQPACQRLDPDLLGCRGLRIGQFGLLQATSCALYQQRAQVVVAAAADAAQVRLATTGVLCGCQAELGRQLSAIRKLMGVADACHQRIGRQWPHTNQLLGAHAAGIGLGVCGNLAINRRDPLFHLLPV